MITSTQLDDVVDRFDRNPALLDEVLTHLETRQTQFLDILIGSNAELLSEDELDYLIFLFAVVYQTAYDIHPPEIFSEEQIALAEESVWAMINNDKNYEALIQRASGWVNMGDLVEFIDLSIGPDPGNEMKISEEGRLIMFAVLLSEAKLLTGIA